jgi:hypothetical protein
MTGPVLHQGAAHVAICPSPCASKVHYRVPNVRLRLEQGFHVAFIAKHSSRLGPDLHQADFADGSDGSGIVGTLDVSDSVGNVGGQSL